MSEIGIARSGPGRTLRAALLSGAVLLGCGQAARAQFAFEDDILPPRVVAWRLADRGYSRLSRPRFDGRVYVVEAVSPTGVPVRLFVDPGVGAVVGRQRLGPPEVYARLEPPRPGFGWTDEDARPALRPVPDAGPARAAGRPEIDPYGVNPDARGDRPRAEPLKSAPPRKIARAAPPALQPDLKPALRTAPEAPAPHVTAPAHVVPAQTAPAQADKVPAAEPGTPAAAGTAALETGPAKPEGLRAEAAKPASPEWRDPPADRRPVRVIGGATVVPGTAGTPGKDADPAQ